MSAIQNKLKFNLLAFGLFWTYLLINIQVLTIFGIQYKDPFFIKIYHLFTVSLFLLIIAIQNYRIVIIEKWALIFFLFILVMSPVLYVPLTSFNSLYVNYVYALLILLLSFQFRALSNAEIVSNLQGAFSVILVIILIKNIVYFDVFVSFINQPYGHPSIPCIFGGGPNLEATWLSIGSLLFLNQRKRFLFVLIISTLISIVYASRVGLVLNIAAFSLYLISPYSSRKDRWSSVILLFGSLIFIIFYFGDELSKYIFILDRFNSLGEDAGSQGRLTMWVGILPALENNLFFGYGAGNAIYAVQPFVARTLTEDNLHMYFIQNFVEFGLLGGLLFISLVINFVWVHRHSKSILKYCFYLYLLGCFIQFRGAEPIIWFLYGLSFVELRNERKIGNAYSTL